ncbi:MAG: methyltransferase [Rhodospirillales bacterium]
MQIFLPAGYTLICVAKYFGFIRASGADHFDPEYRTKPFVRKGVFKYVPNAMYTLGMLLFLALAVAVGSKAMLALTVFYCVYAWVHYFCTERPDMDVIYGDRLEQIRAGIEKR